MPPIIPPQAVGSLISAGAGIFSNIFNNQAIQRNNKLQMDMYKHNLMYNSPKEQMKRFREAGLNPHLIYQQGNSGNAGSAPQTQPGSVDLTSIANVINTYLDLKQKDINIEGSKKDLSGKELNKYISEYMMQTDKTSSPMPDGLRANFMQNIEDSWEQAKNTIQGQKIDNALKSLNYRIGQNTEFISKETERRFKEYGILPEDPDLLKIFKIGTRAAGMSDSDMMNFIIKMITPIIGLK
jgi:hypothetical protein